MSKVEAIQYGDRKVYAVAAFNRGVAEWLQRLPTVWVEGEVTELRRHARWQSVFFTLKDPNDGACLGVTIARSRFDALRLDLADGERVHVFGRPELFAARGDFRLRALSIERFGLGDHLAALERLKNKLAAEGVFERKRPLPFLPRRVGLVTGNDAAAKRDVLATITGRFPAARIVVAEAYVQGPLAAGTMIDALRQVCAVPEVDVIVLARGGGSFEDLLPFSDERLVRRRRPALHASSFPTPPTCSAGSTARAPVSRAARAGCSSDGASDSCKRMTVSGAPPLWPWSASVRDSSRPRVACVRFLPAQPSSAGTRSCGRATRSSARCRPCPWAIRSRSRSRTAASEHASSERGTQLRGRAARARADRGTAGARRRRP